MIADKKARQGFASRLNKVGVLYELHDNLFEQVNEFSRVNSDWRIRTPELLGVQADWRSDTHYTTASERLVRLFND